MEQTLSSQKRIGYMDLVRVIACFMVMMIHVRFAFDLKTETATQFYVAFLRPCVPFFIMISGALLLPLKNDSYTFFKKRFSRVLIPFLFWSVVYVFLPAPTKINFGGIENALTTSDLSPIVKSLLMIPINFTWVNVHFWFMYTILGLYLFMPVISPWIEKTSKRGVEAFLCVWGFTTILFYAEIWFPEMLGVCDWNEFGMFYNFGGYLGYLILGYYLRRYNTLSRMLSISIGLILFSVGGYFTLKGLLYSLEHADKMYWIAVESQKVEFFINNLSINVVMMTAGLFMVLQKISIGGIPAKIVQELSKYSYGIFLVHYFINIWLLSLVGQWDGLNAWIGQPLFAVIVFVASYLFVKALSFIPNSKYLLG
ncbi:acyltransferase family protein [Halosquirtibacter laminarini]|uniref:Acyltransferase family protein n=1 Tax=Halosquirtibacter laminarini TaxID=3374600 RepID=A0AC61NPD6_9BACT|nr:acyltransferase family protein [Prolixibacteraceae bacterium]